ncbi:MAG: AbrB/MazE/SpoVT family DNA-binding domain-containing protein [Chloroflexi bacterium]|nr:AbrB/MazE/SpoVT family DNA-binding domain-containing protein [Chloroflexota bacterium]
MGTGIKTRIVKIGNSQGIRIPKPLLDQVDIREEVELEVQDDQLVIRQVRGARLGWDDQFAKMAEMEDDHLLDEEIINSKWDIDEWEW